MQQYYQTQVLMYNKTGYHTESWDTPTPLSNCHHWCLTGNACGPRGTRPFVMHLRPEAAVRMRLECQEAQCGLGTTLGIPRIPRHAQNAQVTREKGGVASLERVAWVSCSEQDQNVIEITRQKHNELTIRIRSVISIRLNITQYYMIFTSKCSVNHKEYTDIY